MINTIAVDQIISYLLSNTNIAALLGDRIYFGIPIEEPTETYLSINIVSDVTNSDYTKTARLSFSFTGATEGTDSKTIVDIVSTVINEIVGTECNMVFELGTFSVYKITEGNLVGPNITIKNRIIFIKDFLFSYVRI